MRREELWSLPTIAVLCAVRGHCIYPVQVQENYKVEASAGKGIVIEATTLHYVSE